MIFITTINEEIQTKSIRDTLLDLSDIEKEERKKILSDYLFYEGKAKKIMGIDYSKLNNPDLMGQSWESKDNLTYKPSHEIRNKVKTLLKKQARFMFSISPDLNFRPDNVKDKQACELLRKYIDDILEYNNFWLNTYKAFLEATIKKRVVLRLEVNPKRPIEIKYESIENCSYKEKNGHIMEVKFFEEDEQNAYKKEDTQKIYYLHIYNYEYTKADDGFFDKTVIYTKETYKNGKKIASEKIDTEFDTIPVWIIKNGGTLNSTFGESDLEDLKDIQIDYNKTVSDMKDALRFQMFGSLVAIDADPNDVNNFKISPGGIIAAASIENMGDSKQAKIDKIEYNMSNADAVEKHLERCLDDMNFILDSPRLSDLTSIPSAKALNFLYNDLIARCNNKLNDWYGPFKEMLIFIINSAQYCYRDFNKAWLDIKYTIEIKLNFPLPSTIEDAKTIALQEVKEKVRSHRSYIDEFSSEEDYLTEWENIIEETKKLTESESDPFTASIDGELNAEGGENDG